MMASDWSAEVAAQPIGNKKGHDSFNRQIVLTVLTPATGELRTGK